MTRKPSTRDRLLEAAEEVFADKGFYEAAVDEIVTRSGTSKGSVYHHFPSKERLFLAVMELLGKRLVRRVEREVAPVADPVERLDVALETTVRTLCRHRTLAKLLLAKGYSIGPGFARKRQDLFTGFADLTARLIDEAITTSGSRRAGIDARIAAYAWLGAVGEIVVRWLETGEHDPLDDALPTLRVMLLRGLGLFDEDAASADERGNGRRAGRRVP